MIYECGSSSDSFLEDTSNNMSDCKDAQADQNFQMCTHANLR